jgi:hypothetical protein
MQGRGAATHEMILEATTHVTASMCQSFIRHCHVYHAY